MPGVLAATVSQIGATSFSASPGGTRRVVPNGSNGAA